MYNVQAAIIEEVLKWFEYSPRKPVIACECECRVISEEDIPNEEVQKDD